MAVVLSAEVRAFLDAPRLAVLATVNPDGSPHQTVVWYELQGDGILLNTRRGRKKQRNLARDPRVSLCVEDGERFITLIGRVVAMIDEQSVAREDILRLGIRYDGPAVVPRRERSNGANEDHFFPAQVPSVGARHDSRPGSCRV
jgi:PPOX class probable F420-dependent enzyme